jgi:hypothetical protein
LIQLIIEDDNNNYPFLCYRMDDNREIISATECQRLLSECHEIMCSSCDLVHTRCVKVLNIRARAGHLDDLASSEFVSLVRLTENFMSHSIQITGRRCPSLRTALLSQVRIWHGLA